MQQYEADNLSTTMALRQSGAVQNSFVQFSTIRALTGAADSTFSFGPRAARPASAALGDRYFANNIGARGGWLYYWTGTAWAIVVAWASGTDAQRAAITPNSTENGAWFFATDTTKFWEVSAGAWADRTPTGTAASSEPYVTIGNTAGLTAERALVGTPNQIILTDGGANSSATLSTPQNIHTGATPTFAGMIASPSGRLLLQATTPSQIVSNVDNYNPGPGGFFRITTDASRNITGITAGIDGDIIYLRNAGSFDFVLTNQDANSDPENRIITGTGGSVTYMPDEIAELVYDSDDSRWVLIV